MPAPLPLGTGWLPPPPLLLFAAPAPGPMAALGCSGCTTAGLPPLLLLMVLFAPGCGPMAAPGCGAMAALGCGPMAATGCGPMAAPGCGRTLEPVLLLLLLLLAPGPGPTTGGRCTPPVVLFPPLTVPPLLLLLVLLTAAPGPTGNVGRGLPPGPAVLLPLLLLPPLPPEGVLVAGGGDGDGGAAGFCTPLPPAVLFAALLLLGCGGGDLGGATGRTGLPVLLLPLAALFAPGLLSLPPAPVLLVAAVPAPGRAGLSGCWPAAVPLPLPPASGGGAGLATCTGAGGGGDRGGGGDGDGGSRSTVSLTAAGCLGSGCGIAAVLLLVPGRPVRLSTADWLLGGAAAFTMTVALLAGSVPLLGKRAPVAGAENAAGGLIGSHGGRVRRRRRCLQAIRAAFARRLGLAPLQLVQPVGGRGGPTRPRADKPHPCCKRRAPLAGLHCTHLLGPHPRSLRRGVGLKAAAPSEWSLRARPPLLPIHPYRAFRRPGTEMLGLFGGTKRLFGLRRCVGSRSLPSVCLRRLPGLCKLSE